DTISLAAGTGQIKLAHTIPVNTAGIANLNLFDLAGGDSFNVAATQPYTALLLSGGSSTNDTVNLSGATIAVAVNFANSTVANALTTIAGYGGTVSLAGIAT